MHLIFREVPSEEQLEKLRRAFHKGALTSQELDFRSGKPEAWRVETWTKGVLSHSTTLEELEQHYPELCEQLQSIMKEHDEIRHWSDGIFMESGIALIRGNNILCYATIETHRKRKGGLSVLRDIKAQIEEYKRMTSDSQQTQAHRDDL